MLKWFCFRGSCKEGGTRPVERSLNELSISMTDSFEKPKPFVLPDYLTSALGNEKAYKFLERNNCMTAIQNKLCSVRYDPKKDRVVFLIKDTHGNIIDAAGRTLNHTGPKWLRYGSSGHPFICGNDDVGVLVEDCPSACAVSHAATGVAILGTNLSHTLLPPLKRFSKIIVCLDKDASRKALDLASKLRFFVPCTVRLLEDDLKYLTPQQINELLEDAL